MSGNHEDIYKDAHLFLCYDCGRGFSTRMKLTDHTKRNHKLTICNICKKEFTCKQNMERHKVNIHQNRQEENITNEKISNKKRKEGFCNICQLAFKRYYNYKKHQERCLLFPSIALFIIWAYTVKTLSRLWSLLIQILIK